MHTRDQHIEMIKDQDRWPMWPRLPVKRPSATGLQLGWIFAETTTVILANLYEDHTPTTPQIVYPNAEAVYAAGWRVD